MAASPGAVLVLPEALLEHAAALGLPAERLVGTRRRATSLERAGFRVRAVPSAHEGLDTDAAGPSSLSGVRDRVRGAAALS